MNTFKKFLYLVLIATMVLTVPAQAQAVNPPEEPAPEQTADTHLLYLPAAIGKPGFVPPVAGPDWPTLAGNPERTSWTSSASTGTMRVEWYRPVEAYIPQHVQIIATNGLLYISTSKGLYALNADNGATVWQFDTELPLGHSPTIKDGVAYVGGYDRKLYALNAISGALLWSFNGATAGYDTNPLVVDGRIFIGNRDGWMYAIGAHGSAQQGQLPWKYQAGGPIHLSASYSNNKIFFAADDNRGYALRADTGALVWKTDKLPGDGYHAYWPVVYQDKVIFSASISYRVGIRPGTLSVLNNDGVGYGSYSQMEREDMFPTEPNGALLGPTLPPQSWSNGRQVVDASRITQYLEANPAADPDKYKPWRRTYAIINMADGSEYTFDSDGDGFREYMPVAHWGTNSGNRFPPVVGGDGMLYVSNIWQKTGDSQGKVMGWYFGTQYFSIIDGQGAIVEPQALSAAGNVIYRNLCCDRVGDFFDIRAGQFPRVSLWSYNLEDQAPGYDEQWTILPGWPRLHGWFSAEIASVNSAYHNHGLQNSLVPYDGKVFVHRSNAIIAYGPGAAQGKQPLLEIGSNQTTATNPSVADLQAKLTAEVDKMLAAGHLRPGYYNNGQFSLLKELADYYDNPGDTLYTLSIAYPYLDSNRKAQVLAYLEDEFSAYFDPVMYSWIGWADGAAREDMPIPPEVEAHMETYGKREQAFNFSWQYPPLNFYAMWKYAQIVPGNAAHIYDLAKSKLQVPVPSMINNDYFLQRPYEHNAWMSGYIGFLNLMDLAGKSQQDAALRTQVQNELNRLLQLRWQLFTKDSYWGYDNFTYRKHLDVARNFMYMVPELGAYYRANILPEVQAAVAEYEQIAPYWFVSRYTAVIGEGVMAHLHTAPAIFTAKMFILNQGYDDLSVYVDAPAFTRGDLYYIQSLVYAIDLGTP